VNLRIKDSLRRELDARAKENQVSFNQEVRTRLADSLEQETRQSLESLASDLRHQARDIELAWRRFDASVQRSDPPLPAREAERLRREQEEGDKS
jgi:hypothetical protein